MSTNVQDLETISYDNLGELNAELIETLQKKEFKSVVFIGLESEKEKANLSVFIGGSNENVVNSILNAANGIRDVRKAFLDALPTLVQFQLEDFLTSDDEDEDESED